MDMTGIWGFTLCFMFVNSEVESFEPSKISDRTSPLFIRRNRKIRFSPDKHMVAQEQDKEELNSISSNVKVEKIYVNQSDNNKTGYKLFMKYAHTERHKQVKRHAIENNANDVNNTFNDSEMALSLNCSKCILRQEAKAQRIAFIRDEILKKLQLDGNRLPNVTGLVMPDNPPLNKLIREHEQSLRSRSDGPNSMGRRHQYNYNEDNDLEEDTYHSITKRELVFATSREGHNEVPGYHRNKIHFPFENRFESATKILSAYLWIYTRPFTDSSATKILIDRVKTRGAQRIAVHDIQNNNKGKWHKSELKYAVQRWVRRPETNKGLTVSSNDDDRGRALAVTVPENDQDEKHRPVIIVSIEAKKRFRKKRTLGLYCHEPSTEKRCCHYPLEVDFQSFGWDWVIAPKRYTANYCAGNCPWQFLNPKYVHTYVVSQSMQQLNMESIGPCCSAGKMLPMTLIYFSDNSATIKIEQLSNMVVDRCECV